MIDISLPNFVKIGAKVLLSHEGIQTEVIVEGLNLEGDLTVSFPLIKGYCEMERGYLDLRIGEFQDTWNIFELM